MSKQYSIQELVDVGRLRELFENFSKATGFATGFVAYPSQELLITTGWRDICTKFHRACPASAECCQESNVYLTACLKDLKELSIKPCGNGLIDGATPVIIRGVHLASLSTGQVLLAPPDITFFKGLAAKYGYDTDEYLAALAKVPVVTEEQLKSALVFLSSLAVQIAEEGLHKLQIQKTSDELRKAKEEVNRRVERRTLALQKANEQLQIELVGRQRAEVALAEAQAKLMARAEGLEKAVAERTVKLMERTAEREKLQVELLKISEREKQLIAQELHDGLCQNLAGTAFMSRMLHTRLAAENHPDAKSAKEIYDLLGTGVNEARNLSHGLHPVGPQGEGLMNALSQLASTVCNLFHIDCAFEYPRRVTIENETVSTHLFRITQEAINNARKHGEANRVVIGLRRSPKAITLTIEDNGVGIPAKSSKKSGMGLQIMNHRASEIGATVAVRRAGKDGGTVVTCTVPAHLT